MPGLADPLWLVLLGVVPLIRWLHRFRAPQTSRRVSALFLWAGSRREQAAGRKQAKPDPAWRRRALASALLVFVLASPYWLDPTRPIVVWVDDSLSMATVEDGQSRLATALAQFGETWSAEGRPPATLRSLSVPGRALAVESIPDLPNAADWLATPAPPVGPPAGAMNRAADHWLLTDGASDGTRQWAARASLTRVINVGTTPDNLAITRLAAVRATGDDAALDVLVSAGNASLSNASLRLELVADGAMVTATDLPVPAGEERYWQTRISMPAGALAARVVSGDALERDDEFVLDLRPLAAVPITIAGGCGPSLRAALVAHPGLDIVSPDGTAATLHVACPRDALPGLQASGRQLRIHAGTSTALASTPAWTRAWPVEDSFTLAAGMLSVSAWPDPGLRDASDATVLVAGDLPLLIERARAGDFPVVETIVDLESPDLVRQPEYPAFVASLVDLSLGRRLLSEPVATARPFAESRIRPVAVDAAGGELAADSVAAISLSPALLLLALLLLVLDAVLHFRRVGRG